MQPYLILGCNPMFISYLKWSQWWMKKNSNLHMHKMCVFNPVMPEHKWNTRHKLVKQEALLVPAASGTNLKMKYIITILT